MKTDKTYTEAVSAIKEAILRSQHKAISAVNREQLSLYYGIGRFVSQNSRKGFWGTGAIEQISAMLQNELPGLRGFSAVNITRMRYFYEEWSHVINRSPAATDLQGVEYEDITIQSPMATELQNIDNKIILNRQPMADDLKNSEDKMVPNRQTLANDLEVNENLLLAEIRPPAADNFNHDEFLQVPFSHHMEIVFKAKTLDARLFYIRECATKFWNKYTLRDYLKADLYNHRGKMPNNFSQTIPGKMQALKAIIAFKDEYLLDYINVEQLDEREKDLDERVLEQSIVANIKKFIMTFGHDFSFVGNQYRVEVAGEELFIDLLFFNRELNALVAIELKSGKFRSSYLGQLNTYLSALDEYVRKPHENPSIGIILCKEMNNTFVQFAVRDYTKPMGVATYRTAEEMPENWRKVLPDIDELKKLL
ncbi:MAG: PDDEXK nuclease domain-containing protein [Mediterranea sp.]|jgi:predicted nuclease of restriction endonuclease-like (RecB) superfamily|nr:PDDEXK nuclease domain-containing protein [Mediterranea sp.]